MEAMWTRFFPGTKKVKELLQNNAIGDVQYLFTNKFFYKRKITKFKYLQKNKKNLTQRKKVT